jgi:hypothetical protein
MFSLQKNQQRGRNRFRLEGRVLGELTGKGRGEDGTNNMYTHVRRCENNKIKVEKNNKKLK